MKDDGASRSLTQEESLKTPSLITEGELHDEIGELYLQRYTALQNERMTAVKVAAQRMYEAFRYAEDWHVEDWADAKQEATDNRTVLRFASDFFTTVYMLAVTKCFGVYEGRLEQDTDEAHIERERYEGLKASVNIETYAADSVRGTAETFYEQWLKYSSLDRAKEVAGEIMSLVDDYVVAVAFSSLVEEVPIDASHGEWNEAFRQRIPELSDEAFRFFYITFVDRKADELISHLNPTEMPFEELRAWAGITWLEGRAPEAGGFPSYGVPDAGWIGQDVLALSMKPVQAIDRAARRLQTWDVTSEAGPAFLDPNSGHLVTYHGEALPLAVAQTAVRAMSARTADVWRLTTALIFAHWPKGASGPLPVWIDARELCDAMGFTKHKHGGHRPENIAVVVRALRDLTRFHVQLALGSEVYTMTSATGRRTRKRVIDRNLSKVLQVTDVEEVTFLVDDEHLPLRWEITAGDWMKDFPRQFAPLFKSLVALPGRNKTDLWAKALGMELTWQYRQDGGRTKIQRVRTMLKQAGVLDEALRVSNKISVKENFDNAMGIICGLGVCAYWKYNKDDFKEVLFKTHGEFARGAFKIWLDVRVEAVPLPEIAQAMEKLARTRKRHWKNF